MVDSDPPKSLRFFRIGCELCDRGDFEEGSVLLEMAKSLAQEAGNDAFAVGLVEQIDYRLGSGANDADQEPAI